MKRLHEPTTACYEKHVKPDTKAAKIFLAVRMIQ